MDEVKNKKDGNSEMYARLASPLDLGDDERSELLRDAEKRCLELRDEKGVLKDAYRRIAKEKSELSGRMKDSRRYMRYRFLISNAKVDRLEMEKCSFSKGLGFYKVFLVFFIGSFLGVLVEVAWAYIKYGGYESRKGFVYGPFNPVYGFGAVLMTVLLYRYRNRGALYSFLGAMLIGSVLEYLLSFFQERLFGSTSWDYSNVPLNINGRICLLYSIFWGVLGVIWIKGMYPILSYWLSKVPNHIGKNITIVLFVFMIVNALVTLSAVNRWSERVEGLPPVRALDYVLDSYFPDDRMVDIYPNMVFK